MSSDAITCACEDTGHLLLTAYHHHDPCPCSYSHHHLFRRTAPTVLHCSTMLTSRSTSSRSVSALRMAHWQKVTPRRAQPRVASTSIAAFNSTCGGMTSGGRGKVVGSTMGRKERRTFANGELECSSSIDWELTFLDMKFQSRSILHQDGNRCSTRY